MKPGDLIRFRPSYYKKRKNAHWSPPALIISEAIPRRLDDHDRAVFVAICDGKRVMVDPESDEIEVIEKASTEVP